MILLQLQKQRKNAVMVEKKNKKCLQNAGIFN